MSAISTNREDVVISPRRKLSAKARLQVLLDCDGRCECGERIVGPYDVDHRIPLALGGVDEPSNWVALHPECHRLKTAGLDIPRIAKAKRQSNLRLDQPRTVSANAIRSRGFGEPRRMPAKSKRGT